MFKKLHFNFVIVAYIVFMCLIILGTTIKEGKPTKLLIKRYSSADQMQYQSELLFKKGWQISELEAYNNGSTSKSEFIVFYQR